MIIKNIKNLTNNNILLSTSLDANYTLIPINTHKAKKLLMTDYSDAYQNANNEYYIYRGQHDGYLDKPFLSRPNYRHSSNTSNVYTRLFSDILPSWKEYPKRNHSFICTNDHEYAGEYGNIYYVFPKNGTKIAICSKKDIWFSFNIYFDYNMENFNADFIKISKYLLDTECDIIEDIFMHGDKDKILQIFNIMNAKLIEISKNENEIYYFFVYCSKYVSRSYFKKINKAEFKMLIKQIINTSLINFLDRLLNPIKNKIILTDTVNFSKKVSNSNVNEIWFDNDAMFIESYFFDTEFD